jgi:uncharacterized SAM-binding protein YcdF (DUF218 family)
LALFLRRRRTFRPIRTVIDAVVIVAVVWAVGFVWYAGQISRATPGPDNPNDTTTADAVVVLTGAQDRLGIGFELLAAGKAKRMFISGVYRGVDVQQILKALNRSPKEGENPITLGYGADDTVGNARETAEWVARENIRSLILVTSNFHMPRALVEFHAEMPTVTILPHATAPASFKIESWWRYPGTLKLIASEWSKYVGARMSVTMGLRAPPPPNFTTGAFAPPASPDTAAPPATSPKGASPKEAPEFTEPRTPSQQAPEFGPGDNAAPEQRDYEPPAENAQ